MRYKPGDVVRGASDGVEWVGVILDKPPCEAAVAAYGTRAISLAWRYKPGKGLGRPNGWMGDGHCGIDQLKRHPQPRRIMLEYMKWLTK